MIGTSSRAAAQSARRALGDSVKIVGIDLFGDADLRDACDEVHVIASEDFPSDPLNRLDKSLAARSETDSRTTAWMYCGGLENTPESVYEISERFTLLGCDATTVRAVRDPLQVADCLRDAGLPFARVITNEYSGDLTSASKTPWETSRWIAKPVNSCGGHRVGAAFFDSDATAPDQISGRLAPSTFAQQFIEGESQSASFVANGKEAVFLGATRGYTFKDVIPSHPTATDQPFGYTGSSGPLRISAAAQQTWQRIGDALVCRFGLEGLFGVDAIAIPDGSIIPLEVNPRYTSSMELFERVSESPFFQMHIDACVSGILPNDHSPNHGETMTKQIVYARGAMEFSAASFGIVLDAWQDHAFTTHGDIDFADLPYFDSANDVRSFKRGQPIMTVLSRCEGFVAEWT